MREVERVLPCIADPFKVRVICRLDRHPDDLAQLAALMDARYAPGLGVTMAHVGVREVCFYATGKVTITQVDDATEAVQLVEALLARAEHQAFLDAEIAQ